MRPHDLSGDGDRNNAVVMHALKYMEKIEDRYDMVMLLQPTSPIRKSEHIDLAIRQLWESGLPTLASVGPPLYKRDPYIKAIRGGALEPYNPAEMDECEPCYRYNAAIYAAKRGYFLETGKMVSARSVPLIMDRFHSVDVDDEIDLKIAELYMREM